MKHWITKDGYSRVTLHKNGKGTAFGIHHLLGLVFIPNPNNYYSVDHIDTNTSNNNLSNLRWATRKMQNENRKGYGEIKHKYIGYHNKNKYYQIQKTGVFCYRLNVEKYTLDDAIELRTKLLLENGCEPISIDC